MTTVGTTALTPDEARLVETHVKVVQFLAHKIQRTLPVDLLDELIGAGHEGLIWAAQRFNPDKRTAFKTYANFRINGAMIDMLRKHDPVAKSGRVFRKKLEYARKKCRKKLKRKPTDTELAVAMGIQLKTFHAALESSSRQIKSLDQRADPSDPSSPRLLDHIAQEKPEFDPMTEDWPVVLEAIKSLNHRQRSIMVQRFIQGRDLKSIARDLGITESRISQIVSECIIKLRLRARQIRAKRNRITKPCQLPRRIPVSKPPKPTEPISEPLESTMFEDISPTLLLRKYTDDNGSHSFVEAAILSIKAVRSAPGMRSGACDEALNWSKQKRSTVFAQLRKLGVLRLEGVRYSARWYVEEKPARALIEELGFSPSRNAKAPKSTAPKPAKAPKLAPKPAKASKPTPEPAKAPKSDTAPKLTRRSPLSFSDGAVLAIAAVRRQPGERGGIYTNLLGWNRTKRLRVFRQLRVLGILEMKGIRNEARWHLDETLADEWLQKQPKPVPKPDKKSESSAVSKSSTKTVATWSPGLAKAAILAIEAVRKQPGKTSGVYLVALGWTASKRRWTFKQLTNLGVLRVEGDKLRPQWHLNEEQAAMALPRLKDLANSPDQPESPPTSKPPTPEPPASEPKPQCQTCGGERKIHNTLTGGMLSPLTSCSDCKDIGQTLSDQEIVEAQIGIRRSPKTWSAPVRPLSVEAAFATLAGPSTKGLAEESLPDPETKPETGSSVHVEVSARSPWVQAPARAPRSTRMSSEEIERIATELSEARSNAVGLRIQLSIIEGTVDALEGLLAEAKGSSD